MGRIRAVWHPMLTLHTNNYNTWPWKGSKLTTIGMTYLLNGPSDTESKFVCDWLKLNYLMINPHQWPHCLWLTMNKLFFDGLFYIVGLKPRSTVDLFNFYLWSTFMVFKICIQMILCIIIISYSDIWYSSCIVTAAVVVVPRFNRVNRYQCIGFSDLIVSWKDFYLM